MHSYKINTGALLAFVALGAGCHHEEHKKTERGSFLVTSPMKSNKDITSEYVCQIRSSQHIELRALEQGYLQDVFIDEGKPVKKGQRMFQIMPKIYQAELEKALAEAEFARIEYQNTKLLADKDVVSANELSLAKAKLRKAEAEVALSRVHRNLTEIRAPFDGIMGRLHVRRGSLLEEGELLTTLSDNAKMWVYFNVTEAEYLDYRAQAAKEGVATVALVLANNRRFDQLGRVETIESDFNNETGTIAFRATFDNPNDLLRHGETGKVLMTTQLKDALLIPQKATFEILDKKHVFVVGPDNIVRSRAITVSQEVPHLYAVDDGLQLNDRLLLDGLRKVKDGDEITVKFVEPAAAVANLELPAE